MWVLPNRGKHKTEANRGIHESTYNSKQLYQLIYGGGGTPPAFFPCLAFKKNI